MNVITECKQCQGKGITYQGFKPTKCTSCKGTGKIFEIPFTEGPTISPSMGVNTKPAHKLVWNGYWIDFDSNMPRHVFEHLRDLINKDIGYFDTSLEANEARENYISTIIKTF